MNLSLAICFVAFVAFHEWHGCPDALSCICTDVTQAMTHARVENDLEKEYRGVDFDQGCRPAPVSGLCNAYLQRWYFDVSAGSCEQFVYGGCGGNANNYKSQRECEVACLRV